MSEVETAAVFQSESPSVEERTTRFSILHLMLWALFSAMYWSLIRAIFAIQGGSPSEYAVIEKTSSLIQGGTMGAVLMGAIVLLSTRVRYGTPMLRQPGHWLLFVSAIFNLTYVPFMIVVEFVQDPFFSVTFYVMFYWVIFLVPPIAYAFAIRRNHARRWRVIFCALVVVGMAECLSYIDGVPSSLLGLGTGGATEFLTSGRILVSAAVLIVSIVDLVAGERGDWLHWTGITTYVAGASVTLMWTIGYWSNR